MKPPPIVHSSFTLERSYPVPAARVFAAWADLDTKARWFMGPPETWTPVERELDFRVGGREILRGQFAGGGTSAFLARYHAITPNQRLVFAYDMYTGDRHLSVSLATVELAASAGGTRLTFTEQAAFLDGEDGGRSREAGTAAHLDRLTGVLADPHEIVSTRLLDAPRDAVFAAFADPDQLARWWGPEGSRNTFHAFDLRTGGDWRFVMHGADGTEYQMDKHFVEVAPPQRIVMDHRQAGHQFRMTMVYTERARQTQLTWRMRFEAPEPPEIQRFITDANEENFDRLEAHLVRRTE
jgi:uncharacterized protein YndB with AHSA1/START domain